MSDYQIRRRLLDIRAVIKWHAEDVKDDFYPDPINYRDICEFHDDFFKAREHRFLQIDSFPPIHDDVPKAELMLRPGIWLHPVHRLLYLCLLNKLLPLINPKIPSSIYSYRDDRHGIDGYPFQNRVERWMGFHNDFRRSLLTEDVQCVLITDLAAYYDHIEIDCLARKLESIIGPGIDEEATEAIGLLKQLLHTYSSNGHGIPQNYDPSSFFGSVYLYNTDREMEAKRYNYFRWVDDIRIACKNRKQALRALHELQKSLARDRLFLNSAKTKILEKGSSEFEGLIDVTDDILLSRVEEACRSKDRRLIDEVVGPVLSGMERNAGPNGDDRKFRAFVNRALEIGSFRPYTEHLRRRVREFVLPRLATHPGRTDYWFKMLKETLQDEDVDKVWSYLDDDPSVYNWQRFFLWRLLAVANVSISSTKVESALQKVATVPSVLESGAIAVFIGRHGSNDQRERLFQQYFTRQISHYQQRCIIIAVQELPIATRDGFFSQALRTCPEHSELIEYLKRLTIPNYGQRPRSIRDLPDSPKSLVIRVKSGIGKSDGQAVSFRMVGSSIDYE